MASYVIPVSAPAPGTDWAYTVPGQYIEHITGITATLTTAGASTTTMKDASGNGLDGTYVNIPTTVAGLVPGDEARRSSAGQHQYETVAHPILDLDLDWSVEMWLQIPVGATLAPSIFFYKAGGTPGVPFLQFGADLSNQWLFVQATGTISNGVWISDFGGFPIDGNPHYCVITNDAGGNNVQMYVDGASVNATQNFGPWAGFATTDTVDIMRSTSSPTLSVRGTVDEVAFYDTVLSPADVAAHFAAAGNIATYAPAVLAGNPAAYYHMDTDTTPAGGRQVAFEVTNQTEVALLVPTGFPDAATGSTFTYSWQPNLNSSSQTPDGSVTTVAIPDLILPAGYTVGSRTFDLAPGDQWSDIFIWWDSAYMDALDPLNAYVFPGGIRLVYQQVKS